MGQVAAIDPAIGCPSGMQDIPISTRDPLGSRIDLSAYVTAFESSKKSIDLIVQGAHCAGCVAKIERGVKALPHVENARMNLSTLRLNVKWSGSDDQANDILATLTDLGFGAVPYSVDTAQLRSEAESKFLLRAIAVAGFAMMNVMLLSIAVWSGGGEMSTETRGLFHWISALIAIPTVMYSGQPFFRSAWSALKNVRRIWTYRFL